MSVYDVICDFCGTRNRVPAEKEGKQGRCGWLVDAFGLSWQIVPTLLGRLFGDPDREAAGRAQAAMMRMTKLDMASLQAAFDGS